MTHILVVRRQMVKGSFVNKKSRLRTAIRCSCSPDSTLGMESEETFFNSQLLKTNFLPSEAPRPAVGRALSRFQWIPGLLAPGVKRPGLRADC